MKDLFTKYFGLFGLVLYYPIVTVARIFVAVFLLVVIAFVLLVLNPLRGSESTPRWVNDLYDWYCGK